MQWDLQTDIVVVGSGGCGMAPAVAAAERGADVIVHIDPCGK